MLGWARKGARRLGSLTGWCGFLWESRMWMTFSMIWIRPSPQSEPLISLRTQIKHRYFLLRASAGIRDCRLRSLRQYILERRRNAVLGSRRALFQIGLRL